MAWVRVPVLVPAGADDELALWWLDPGDKATILAGR